MREKKIALFVVSTLFAVSAVTAIVSGCGRSSVSTEIVRMPDGKDVVCVWKRHGYAGGLSCDFEGIKK